MSWSLAEKVLTRCARTLQPYIIKAFKSTGTSLDLYSPVVSSICQTVFEAPKVHNAVNNTKENEVSLKFTVQFQYLLTLSSNQLAVV